MVLPPAHCYASVNQIKSTADIEFFKFYGNACTTREKMTSVVYRAAAGRDFDAITLKIAEDNPARA